MRKKILVALAATIAAAAFVPAMASATGTATAWTGLPSSPTSINGSAGTLTLSAPGTGVTVTCDVEVTSGFLTNSPIGYGEISAFTITTPCGTNIDPDCFVVAASASASTSVPWTIQAHNDGGSKHVHLNGVSFSNTFDSVPECGSFAGASVTASGNLTGTVSGGSLVLSGASSGALTTSPNIGPAYVSGSVAITPSGIGY